MTGNLYLIPTIISPDTASEVLSPKMLAILPNLRIFFAEDIRTARRFLSSLKIYAGIEELNFYQLDKDTSSSAMADYFAPVFSGHDVGLLSESGCPGVADPGSIAVRFAHAHQVRVVPLVGPSSILLALMASGLNGQRFTFLGYLPQAQTDLKQALRQCEKNSRIHNETQLFIETPYRNNQLIHAMLSTLHDETLLCIAYDLTGKDEFICTQRIADWKARQIQLPKTPAIFLILSS